MDRKECTEAVVSKQALIEDVQRQGRVWDMVEEGEQEEPAGRQSWRYASAVVS